MSVILDIFDEMIGAISSLRRNFKKSVIYLAPIGVGMVLGVLLLSGILSGMLQSHPVEMQLFFIGVVAGSIPLVVRKSLEEPFRRHSLLALIATLAVMICIFFVRPDDSGVELMRDPSLIQMVQLILYAAFAAAAMVIPGVSGSFFLMLFGVYHSVLTAVSEWNFAVLVPTGIGMIIGILFCAKMLDILLQQHKQAVYFGILGCVVGSIPNIWPSQPVEGMDILWGLLACLAGAGLSLLCTSNFLRGLFSRRKTEEK